MPPSISRVVLWCGLLVLVAAIGGCQRGPTWNLAPVEGTVTKDGQPLHHIEVVFLADLDSGTQGPRSSGATDEAGHYRLRTDNGDEGTVVGKHRVLILDLQAAKGLMGRTYRWSQQKKVAPLPPEHAKRLQNRLKPAAEASRVSPNYGRFDETPLRFEVQPGPQVIDLEVK
jgi:hypothetical protein